MKRLFLSSAIFLFVSNIAFCQDILRCITSSKYTYYDDDGEKVINSPAAVCYTDYYITFYTSKTGTVFLKTHPISLTKSRTSKGEVITDVINEAWGNIPYAYYSLSITYGLSRKTAIINLMKSGAAIEFSNTHFEGSIPPAYKDKFKTR